MKMIMSDVLKNRDAVPRDLATLIDMQAAAKPEALAIIAPIGRLTYGAVSTMISRIAAGLASTGLKPGDNVAVTLGKNVPELLTILALSRIGCTAGTGDPTVPAGFPNGFRSIHFTTMLRSNPT